MVDLYVQYPTLRPLNTFTRSVLCMLSRQEHNVDFVMLLMYYTLLTMRKEGQSLGNTLYGPQYCI